MTEPSRDDHGDANALDVPLQDDEQLDEVSLLADLMVAADRSDRALDEDQLDRLLGL
jgi:hypothetical protein